MGKTEAAVSSVAEGLNRSKVVEMSAMEENGVGLVAAKMENMPV